MLKDELGLSYLKAKKLHPNANSTKVLIQRQQYALALLDLLEQGKRIINVDETWLNETSFVRRLWARRGGDGNTRLNSVSPRLSMIAALDISGKVWFSLSHSTTDSDVMAAFLLQLSKVLDEESPGWQEETVILWDNAPYHVSAETQHVINRQGIQVIYSGPYSYSAAPVETLFSGLKLGELNTDGDPTGKR